VGEAHDNRGAQTAAERSAERPVLASGQASGESRAERGSEAAGQKANPHLHFVLVRAAPPVRCTASQGRFDQIRS